MAQRNLCLSPWPTTASREEGRGHSLGGPCATSLCPQMHPCHSNGKWPQRGGPCPKQRATWDNGSLVSTDECKCLQPLRATSLRTTQTGLCKQEAVHTQAPRNAQQSPAGEKPWGIHRPSPFHPHHKVKKKLLTVFFHPHSCIQTKTFLALLHPSAADPRAHVHTGLCQ